MYTFLKRIDWAKTTTDILNIKNSNDRRPAWAAIIKNSSGVFMNSILPILGSIKPIQKDGLYSATETFAAIPDVIETPYVHMSKDEFRDYFIFLDRIAPSTWVQGKLTKNPQFSRLSPIMLLAFKRYHNVKYSQWDFSDPALKYMMNDLLFNTIQYMNTDFSGVDKLRLRDEMLYMKSKDEYRAPGMYPNRANIEITDTITVKATDPLALMLGQVWVAHKSFRTEDLVLDPNDWDAIPEPIDLAVEEIIIKPELKFEAPF